MTSQVPFDPGSEEFAGKLLRKQLGEILVAVRSGKVASTESLEKLLVALLAALGCSDERRPPGQEMQ